MARKGLPDSKFYTDENRYNIHTGMIDQKDYGIIPLKNTIYDKGECTFIDVDFLSDSKVIKEHCPDDDSGLDDA